MKRKLYIRLSILVLAISLSLMLVSYARMRSHTDDPTNECGNKCSGKKAQTEYILWESITRNLLMVKG